ncbi:hypothetical protein ACFQ44_04565 [Levilactobacillus lanxiensis]|uniref:MucBP domain-containing protein n=1 Tax=Levilactobacillus lanxiensis TaxID=2799568 RepID=A0ABW4D2K7_9LACO|nr:hypothetical protein [Levilactobacillus lanxiensis]
MKNKNWWFKVPLIVVTAISALVLGAGNQAHAADDTPSNIAVVKMSLDDSMVQLDAPLLEAYTLDGQKSDIPFWGQNGTTIPNYTSQYAINLDTGTLYYSCSSTDFSTNLWFPANDQTVLIPSSLPGSDSSNVQTRTFTFSFLNQNGQPLTTSESIKASYSPNANYPGDPFTGLADSLKTTDTTTHKLIASRAFPGYKLRDQDPVTNTDSDYDFTYHYVKDTPTSKPSTGTSTAAEADSASTSSSSVTPV